VFSRIIFVYHPQSDRTDQPGGGVVSNRRDFLRGTAATALSLSAPADLFAQAAPVPASAAWDSGAVRHLLPAVSDSRILIKVRLPSRWATRHAPVDGTSVAGRMSDTRGEHWHFHATDLGRDGRTGWRWWGAAAAPCVSRGSLRPSPDRTKGRNNSACCSFPARRP
jgi:hypothetical protein